MEWRHIEAEQVQEQGTDDRGAVCDLVLAPQEGQLDAARKNAGSCLHGDDQFAEPRVAEDRRGGAYEGDVGEA